MQRNQVFNPYLPLHEYIPDGEPHVFGDRVYIYGSHDREGGYTFCMEDYVTYSAPVDDLSDWRYEGVIYKAENDPMYPNPKYMYAPDVVRGNDGRYYLYYCMGGDYGRDGYSGPISVAVCDTPAGEYEYLGVIRNADGSPMMRYVCFDPAAINDNGTIRIYYGTQYGYEEESGVMNALEIEMDMFGKTREEILSYPDSINGAIMVVLEDDMLTVKEEPKHIIPYKVKGTSFEEHPFFEGSSMRRVGDKYYFIYSSWQNHELCYAVSDYPDRDFVYGGTIVSNGDVGLDGRSIEDKLNMTGTNHGSICYIDGQWYIFYHRLTHKSDYSRQACAEKVSIEADGSIKQVEVTSCGLNDGALEAYGSYPAVICCNLTNGNMPHGCNSIYTKPFPNITNIGEDRFIGEIGDKTLIGYKYFDFKNVTKVGVRARIENDDNRVVYDGPVRLDERCDEDDVQGAQGTQGVKDDRASGGDRGDVNYIELYIAPYGEEVGRIVIDDRLYDGTKDPFMWHEFTADVHIPDGVHPLYLVYRGSDRVQVKEIVFLT